jgi:hypothetical protein
MDLKYASLGAKSSFPCPLAIHSSGGKTPPLQDSAIFKVRTSRGDRYQDSDRLWFKIEKNNDFVNMVK